MPRFQIYAGVLTAICIGWVALIMLVPGVASGQRISEDFHEIPMNVTGWSGRNAQFQNAAQTFEILSTASLLSRQYSHEEYGQVELDIVLGLDIGDFHQPEVCMGGAGWTLVERRTVLIHPKGMPEHEAIVYLMKNDFGGDIALLYWFYMGGRVTAAGLESKLTQAFHDAFHGRQPGAMVKFTSEVVDSNPDKAIAADTALCEQLESYIIQDIKKKPKFEDSDLVLKNLTGSSGE